MVEEALADLFVAVDRRRSATVADPAAVELTPIGHDNCNGSGTRLELWLPICKS